MLYDEVIANPSETLVFIRSADFEEDIFLHRSKVSDAVWPQLRDLL